MQYLVRRKRMAGFAQLGCRRNQRHPGHAICSVDGVARRAPHRHRRVHVLALLQRAMAFQACRRRSVRLQRYRMFHDSRAGRRRALGSGPTLRLAAQSTCEYDQREKSATVRHLTNHGEPVRRQVQPPALGHRDISSASSIAQRFPAPPQKQKPRPRPRLLHKNTSDYLPSLRRSSPASPIAPDPNSIRLPGSGTVL